MPADSRSPVAALLWSVVRAEWRHHALRQATAVLAVLLGVALAFSVHLINASALSEFSAAVRSVNGQADASLRASQGTLDAALYARVARAPGVQRASPVVDVKLQALDRQGRAVTLRLLGLDVLVAGALTPQWVPRLRNPGKGGDDPPEARRSDLFATDAIALNPPAQRALGVQPGDRLTVRQGLRTHTLRVVGDVGGVGEPTGVMDVAAAQALLDPADTGGRLQRIDLQLQPGARLPDVLTALRLPPGVVSESPDEASQRVSNVSRAYRVNLTVLALVALFTGAFLVFSIQSLSVAKRMPSLALLGVLGLSARERLRLVLWESAAVGLIGSVLGLAVGTGLAALALRLLSGDLGGGYFPGIAPSLQWSPAAALLYGALGVVAAVLGGWVPARDAQALAPAQALKGLGDVRAHAARPWVGPALLGLGVALTALPPVAGVPLWAYLSVACLLLGGIACVPAAVGALLALWPHPQQAAALLAVERARRMRQTATVAIAGVVASLSLSVALTVMVASFRTSVTDWLDVILPADLYARVQTAGSDNAAPTFERDWVDAVRALPGVLRAEGIRVSPLRLDPARPDVDLIARPLSQPDRDLPLVSAVQPPRDGHVGVWVSEAMVDLYGAQPGTALRLPLVAGQPLVSVWVRGVWRDYARQQGAIVMPEADYRRLTGDDRLNNLALWLAPGTRTATVEQALREQADARGLAGSAFEFAEPRQIREITLRIFDRSFAVTYWLQAVAIGIGLFGTAASFSAQVLARRKEFGLLGHLGFTRRQTLGIVAGEGLALTSVGALLGLVLGLAVSVVLVKVVNPQSFHWTMELMLPWGRLALLCGGVIAAGTVTAVLAGRRAVGHDAVMAVKEDW